MRSNLVLLISLIYSQKTESFLSPAVLQQSIRHQHQSQHRLYGGFFNLDIDNFDDNSSDDGSSSGHRGGARNINHRRLGRRDMTPERRQRLEREQDRQSRFLSGDDLQRLRKKVLDLRHELSNSPTRTRKRELEQTILKAQQMDAEFIYQVATERAEAAQHSGLVMEAAGYQTEAQHARSALPQFNLEGLWVGKFGDHGFEIINCTYHGDTLIATKVTGDRNVPKGEVSFQVDLSPTSTVRSEQQRRSSSIQMEDLFQQEGSNAIPSGLGGSAPQPLEPIELNKEAAEQWGSRYLQRFQGSGQVASRGFRNAQWMEGQLILVGTSYFSFAWLPIGHQVFFGRPSAEMTLKLLRESQMQDQAESSDERLLIEKCWEETELLEDNIEVAEDSLFVSNEQQDYFHMEGCFE
eukprot:CAMPEP_0198138552 /NCGR_PEP_ID=MMETSP1443-20131203/1937_1 /TAXON_ID=186043 /ORGANISM="Entomoneis sp., Strain CCMP2396" /LENGTH=407 /DNA_ID=CAMNT_0043800357 /DNA_START=168 /DNA_END=1391 /DNA_ORIENTATION=+